MNVCPCGEEGIVGIGTETGVVYVCMPHFEDWLREKRQLIDRLAEVARGS